MNLWLSSSSKFCHTSAVLSVQAKNIFIHCWKTAAIIGCITIRIVPMIIFSEGIVGSKWDASGTGK
jgi:hypothetical protein